MLVSEWRRRPDLNRGWRFCSPRTPIAQAMKSRNYSANPRFVLSPVGWNMALLAPHGDNFGDSFLSLPGNTSASVHSSKLNENEPANRYPTERESLCLVF